jgi:methanogenic corrinoid protein MtbC1
MVHLRPYFASGEVKRRGVFVVGTVAGDLHDIGKNILAMMVEGAGWEVVDLGVDVKAERFLAEIEKHPGCVIGLSALLTTTMVNMEKTVQQIQARHPGTLILVGGAPVTAEFCRKIGASHYSPDPQGAVLFLNSAVVAA